ncbi:phosphatidylserine decarboxylase-domain-containing protein [Hyaloraphidium curvatum]|nr:phosphatidylserine decarboxylase-domain-containing protein [Hyaloraphidium curvatum]
MDHLLVCASASRFSTSTYLTEDAAARGLYTSWSTYLLTRFGFGTYKVGSVEGHILVQNRETGRLEEEYIPSYVRLGIQLLYRNRVSRSAVEMATVENALKSATMAHGPLYDDPASKAEIPDFIKTYSIDVDEIAKPLSEYANMNDFFSRGLKPGMRKLDSPGDPKVLVSAADCRLTCFPTVTEATKIWVKGTDFTVFQLLGGDAKISKEFQDCTMVIHRLAPQDYHRWHCPVDGRVDKIVPVRIPGHYYTVNPMAVRSTVNVFGENVREVCYVNSPTFGRVAVVAVGAMMVGSIVWLVKEGQQVGRMDEMGLFKFGGSTVILLVKKGIVTLDQDLVANSAKALETVVRVGNRVGIAGSP